MDTSELSSEMLSFRLLTTEVPRLSPRLGQLMARGRQTIQTPSYIASTSRGALPHITPDVLQKHTSVSALYFGLEDFIEKSPNQAPILQSPSKRQIQGQEQDHAVSRLNSFTGLPDHYLTILGPRRLPTIKTSKQNSNSSIAILTAVGFSELSTTDYVRATKELQPALAASIADVVLADAVSKKRIEKSGDRTHAWLRDTLDDLSMEDSADTHVLASIPPVDAEQQSIYLADLSNEYVEQISGVCLYSTDTTSCIPEALHKGLTVCLNDPESPHDVLHAISLGVDLITVPLVTRASEAGICLTFQFGRTGELTSTQDSKLPLGSNIWTTDCSKDISALTPNCSCYTCTRHHKAFIHHLLQAKEMLAWTLLQIHNFHILHEFFRHVRESIARGTFDCDSQRFAQLYDRDLPAQTGEGPRLRGYQTKSIGGGEPKINRKAYGRLEEQARKIQEAESGVAAPAPDDNADELEQRGFAEKIDQK